MRGGIFEKIVKGALRFDRGQPVLCRKIPYMMFPARSMAVFIQEFATDFDDGFIFQLGYEAGELAGAEFLKQLGWFEKKLVYRQRSLFRMLEVMGFGKVDIKHWNAKENKVLIHMSRHPVIEHAIKLFGKNEKASLFYRGVYSAHSHFEFGIENCRYVETQSQSKGDKVFEWSFNFFYDAKREQ